MSILQLYIQERAHTFEMGGVIMSQLWLCSPGATPDMRQQGLCGQNVWEVMGEVRQRGVWDVMAGHVGHDSGACGMRRRSAWDAMAGRMGRDGGARRTRRAGHVGHNGQDAWDMTGRACGT